jgi:hypothetical protein
MRDVVNLPRRGEQWEIFLAKHEQALRCYIPRRYDGRVAVFKARTHPLLWTNDCERVWQRLSTDVQVHEVSGTHLSMLHEPHVAGLASAPRSAPDQRRIADSLRRRDQVEAHRYFGSRYSWATTVGLTSVRARP